MRVYKLQGGPKMAHYFIHQFQKLFHCQNHKIICNNAITKNLTTPRVSLHYLLKCTVFEMQIENKTSVTTYFKKLTAEINAFGVSVIV